MRYTPDGDRRTGTVMGIVLFALSALLACFSMAGVGNSDMTGVMSAFSTIAAVFVLLRYRFTAFTYIIKPREGVDLSLYCGSIYSLPAEMLDFEVVRSCGRSKVTECLMGLDALCRVLHYNDFKKKKDRDFDGEVCHYTAKILSRDRLALVFDDDCECFAVVIDPSEEIKAFLDNIIKRK